MRPGAGGNFCYPIPTTSLIEGGPSAASGADRHLLFLDTTGAPTNCTLYELYKTQNYTGSGFTAANGAIFKLNSAPARRLDLRRRRRPAHLAGPREVR